MKPAIKYPVTIMKIVMKYPSDNYENHNEISRNDYENRLRHSDVNSNEISMIISENVLTRQYLIKPLSIIHNLLQAIAWFLS